MVPRLPLYFGMTIATSSLEVSNGPKSQHGFPAALAHEGGHWRQI
jgi:hypothetical protein